MKEICGISDSPHSNFLTKVERDEPEAGRGKDACDGCDKKAQEQAAFGVGKRFRQECGEPTAKRKINRKADDVAAEAEREISEVKKMHIEFRMSSCTGQISELLSRYSENFELQPPGRMENVSVYAYEETNGHRKLTLSVSQ